MSKIIGIFNILALCAIFGLSATEVEQEEVKSPIEQTEQETINAVACNDAIESEEEVKNPLEQSEEIINAIVCNDVTEINSAEDKEEIASPLLACKDC